MSDVKRVNTVLTGAHGSRAFDYPHQVVKDPNLDVEEKRAILSAWASDRNAVESLPTLRHLPGTAFPVTFSSIMDARSQLDRLVGCNDDDPPPSPGAISSFAARKFLMEAA